MASVNKLISDFRFDANADTSRITDAKCLDLLNRTYRDLINSIRTINEDYFYNEWKIDGNTVIGQSEYPMLVRTALTDGMNKVKGVSIKYSANANGYSKARLETMNNLAYDLEYYKDKQSNSDPFFVISDKSIFVFPAPTEEVAQGIKFYGIADPIDLILGDAEEKIKIPLEYHDLLLLGMKRRYYASKNMINEKNDTLNEFTIEKTKMLKVLGARSIAPSQITTPNLSYYC